MKNDRTLSMLGLAKKAGKVVSGEFSVENALKGRKALLVILASDTSENTKKKFTNMSTYRNIPLIIAEANKEALGKAVGCELRSVVAVNDPGFANKLYEMNQKAD